MGFSVYSLNDVVCTINNPNVGQMILSDASAGNGSGRIVITFAGEMYSNTKTANGYVTINKMRAEDGSVALEIPVNSPSDMFMRKWADYQRTCPTVDCGNTILTVYDPVRKVTLTMNGVVPQKKPDENFDQTAGNKNYALLFAELFES